jgi:hypothetical protein
MFHAWQESVAMASQRGQSQETVRHDVVPEEAASFLIAMVEGYEVLARRAVTSAKIGLSADGAARSVPHGRPKMPKSRWLEARRRKPYRAMPGFWSWDAMATKRPARARTVLYVLSREGGCRLPTLPNSGIPNFEVRSVSILRPCDRVADYSQENRDGVGRQNKG